jgi:hypothetical protein
MQDAQWLVGIGRVSKSVFGEGADKQTSLLHGQNTPHKSRILLSNCRRWYLIAQFAQPLASSPIEGTVQVLPPHQIVFWPAH